MEDAPPHADQTACPGLNALLCDLVQHCREEDWTTLMIQHGDFIRRTCRAHLPSEAWLDDAVQAPRSASA